MPLERELETYNRELPNLAKAIGKFALVKGDKIIGTYSSYEDALQEGYQEFGLESFLVKEIQAVQQVQYVTRMLETTCLT